MMTSTRELRMRQSCRLSGWMLRLCLERMSATRPDDGCEGGAGCRRERCVASLGADFVRTSLRASDSWRSWRSMVIRLLG